MKRKGGRVPGISTGTPGLRGPYGPFGLWPSGDAPDAAGEELGTGDLLAGLDGGLVRFVGGGEGEPLGIELGVLGDVDGLGAGAS